MNFFVKKNSYIKNRELALKKNIFKRKKGKIQKKIKKS